MSDCYENINSATHTDIDPEYPSTVTNAGFAYSTDAVSKALNALGNIGIKINHPAHKEKIMSEQENTTTEPAKSKAGYKTTEFWLSTVAAIAGIVMASGMVGEGSQASQIVGGIITVLSTLGYTGARAGVKKVEGK